MPEQPHQRGPAEDASSEQLLHSTFHERLDSAIQNEDADAMLQLAADAQKFESESARSVLTVGALLAARVFGSAEASKRLVAFGDSYRDAGDLVTATAIYNMAEARDRIAALLDTKDTNGSPKRQEHSGDTGES